jgi:bacterial/archaeal transporter family-2 protein
MSAGTAAAVVFTVAAGIAGAVQVAVMGRFGERIGTFEAWAFAAALTGAIAFAVVLVVRQSLDGYAAAVRAPPWLWLGALMGGIVVLAITIAAPRIGATATIGIITAGNLIVGVVFDRFGLFGLDRIGLTWPRLLGVLLLGLGAALVLRK